MISYTLVAMNAVQRVSLALLHLKLSKYLVVHKIQVRINPSMFILLLMLLAISCSVGANDCCQVKVLNTVKYYLVTQDDSRTQGLGCKNNCIYQGPYGNLFCFKDDGDGEPVHCENYESQNDKLGINSLYSLFNINLTNNWLQCVTCHLLLRHTASLDRIAGQPKQKLLTLL